LPVIGYADDAIIVTALIRLTGLTRAD